MVANGTHASEGLEHSKVMSRVFPEARASLKEADPELYGIIQDEKKRQW